MSSYTKPILKLQSKKAGIKKTKSVQLRTNLRAGKTYSQDKCGRTEKGQDPDSIHSISYDNE